MSGGGRGKFATELNDKDIVKMPEVPEFLSPTWILIAVTAKKIVVLTLDVPTAVPFHTNEMHTLSFRKHVCAPNLSC